MDKKDYKYILKRVITFFIIFFILLFFKSCNVHAATFDVTTNTTIANYNLPDWWDAFTDGRNLVVKYQDWQNYSQMSETGFASYGYFYVCATANFSVNNNNADCSDGCFQNDFQVVSLGGTCNPGNDTKPGQYYFIFYSVKKWGWANSQTLPIVYDTLTFKGINDRARIYFYSNNLSDDNLFTNYAGSQKLQELQQQTINQINSSTSSIINNQNSNQAQNHQDSINTQNAINSAKNQAHTDAQDTQNAINSAKNQAHQDSQEMKNTITDTSSPTNLNGLSQSAGWLPPGPVDSILNLPLSLLNNISDNLSKSCQPVILTIPYVNSTLTLPCLNTLYDQMGVGPLLSFVGTIVSCFILLSYLLKLYKWVDDTLTFRENNYIDNWGGI